MFGGSISAGYVSTRAYVTGLLYSPSRWWHIPSGNPQGCLVLGSWLETVGKVNKSTEEILRDLGSCGQGSNTPASPFSCPAFSCFFTLVTWRPEGKGMVVMPSEGVTVTGHRAGQRKHEERWGGENGIDFHGTGLTPIFSFRFTAQGWEGIWLTYVFLLFDIQK